MRSKRSIIIFTLVIFTFVLFNCSNNEDSINPTTTTSFKAVYCDIMVTHSGTENPNYPSSLALNGPRGCGDTCGSLDVFNIGKCQYAIFSFSNYKIINASGADFKVYENGFFTGGDSYNRYWDLGLVEVSKDLVSWNKIEVEYSSSIAGFTETNLIGKKNFAGMNPTYINVDSNQLLPTDSSSGGDAFDLSDFGIQEGDYIKYIKLTDACTSYADGNSTFDNGFDLDSIAAINYQIEN